MLDWLIIGGGVHGTYLSHLLVNQVGVSRDDVRVLDPHAKPLATWLKFTANSGMTYLRSPATHNIDLPILSLYRFAKQSVDQLKDPFIPPYNRPSLTLFNKHCRHVIQHNRLEALRIKGRALSLEKNDRLIFVQNDIRSVTTDGKRIRLMTGSDSVWADHVILATGFNCERPGGSFIDSIIRRFGLKCGPCGYPIIGQDLRWSDNIFVAGPLAELQLGPCARNIIGARNAGRHLLSVWKAP
jgi:hypothetical protein